LIFNVLQFKVQVLLQPNRFLKSTLIVLLEKSIIGLKTAFPIQFLCLT